MIGARVVVWQERRTKQPRSVGCCCGALLCALGPPMASSFCVPFLVPDMRLRAVIRLSGSMCCAVCCPGMQCCVCTCSTLSCAAGEPLWASQLRVCGCCAQPTVRLVVLNEKSAGSHRVPKIIMLTKPAEILTMAKSMLSDEADSASCVWERTHHCYIGLKIPCSMLHALTK